MRRKKSSRRFPVKFIYRACSKQNIHISYVAFNAPHCNIFVAASSGSTGITALPEFRFVGKGSSSAPTLKIGRSRGDGHLLILGVAPDRFAVNLPAETHAGVDDAT